MLRLIPAAFLSLSLTALCGAAHAQDQAPPTQQAPDASGSQGPSKPVSGKLEIGTLDAANGQLEREERIIVAFPPEKPAVIYTFTNRGGTTSRAILQEPRFTRDAHAVVAGVPPEKVAGGQIDLVSTWGPRLLPFGNSFIELDYAAPTSILLRRAQDGVIAQGQLQAPAKREALVVDRPVREDDTLIVSAPANVAGEYRVASVGAGGSLRVTRMVEGKAAADFPVADAAGVAYELRRVGSPKELFSDDPTFTRISKEPGLPLVYVWPNPALDDSNVWIERRIEAGSHPYELKLVVTVHNLGDQVLKVMGGLRIGAWQHPETGSPSLFGGPTAVLQASCLHADGLEHAAFGSLREEAMESYETTGQASALRSFPTGAQWISADTNYFIQAAVPTPINELGGQCRLEYREFNVNTPGAWMMAATIVSPNSLQIPGRLDGCVPDWLPTSAKVATGAPRCSEAFAALGVDPAAGPDAIKGAYEAKRKAAGADTAAVDRAWDQIKNRRQATWRYNLYSGPKDTDALELSHPELKRAVQFGWMSFVGAPLHKVMVWFHDGVGSWPLAIILLTIVLKLLTWPLSQKSYVSMQKMKNIKPKLDELKRKFGNDRQKFAQEQMALMRREGVNPFAGCFPMLVQVPIWMGLYGAILGSVELYREPLGLWVPDLSAADPYFILPILLGVLMFVQTLLTPQAGMEEMQAKIMKYGMPIMFTLFMLFLPSGLVLYILVNTLLTIGQNLLIKRKMEAAS